MYLYFRFTNSLVSYLVSMIFVTHQRTSMYMNRMKKRRS